MTTNDPTRMDEMPIDPGPAAPIAPPAAPSMDLQTWGLLIGLSLLWGGSFLFGRIAVLEIPPLTAVFFRVFLAAIAIWLWMIATRGWPAISRWFALNILGMAILNNVIPFSLILNGQQEIGSGLASIVNAMTPVWTVLIAHAFTADEKLSRRKLCGILTAFSGVVVLMGGDALAGFTASALAQISVLGAALSYGFASVYGKRFAGEDPMLVASGQLAASSLMMGAILAASGGFRMAEPPSPAAIGSLVALAIPCTAFAYVLFFTILKRAGATNVSLVTFLVPVSGILLGILVLGETLSLWQAAGMALIVSGLVILDGRLLHRLRG